MRDYTLDDFTGLVGETFDIDTGESTMPMKLAVARKLPTSHRPGGSFRLEWVGAREPVLPQAIYPMRHGDETYELFIVPVESAADGIHYEAIFN